MLSVVAPFKQRKVPSSACLAGKFEQGALTEGGRLGTIDLLIKADCFET
jgi:hypothetical protein